MLLYKTLPPLEKVGIWSSDVCDGAYGALQDRDRWDSFVSHLKGTSTLKVPGLMVGYGKHDTLL